MAGGGAGRGGGKGMKEDRSRIKHRERTELESGTKVIMAIKYMGEE